MRLVFLLATLLLLAGSAVAQSAPTPPIGSVAADSGAVLVFNNWYLPRYQPGPRAGADTTGALLSLFRKRRYAGWLFTVPYIVGISLALPLSSTDQYGRRQVADKAISPPLGILLLGGTVAGFIVHANRFNKRHLLNIDRAYAAGRPIPASYRHLLSGRHFAEAALLRQAIEQQQARAGAAR